MQSGDKREAIPGQVAEVKLPSFTPHFRSLYNVHLVSVLAQEGQWDDYSIVLVINTCQQLWKNA